MTYEFNAERKALVLNAIVFATGASGMSNPNLAEHAMHFGRRFDVTREEVEAVLAMTVAEAVGHKPD